MRLLCLDMRDLGPGPLAASWLKRAVAFPRTLRQLIRTQQLSHQSLTDEGPTRG